MRSAAFFLSCLLPASGWAQLRPLPGGAIESGADAPAAVQIDDLPAPLESVPVDAAPLGEGLERLAPALDERGLVPAAMSPAAEGKRAANSPGAKAAQPPAEQASAQAGALFDGTGRARPRQAVAAPETVALDPVESIEGARETPLVGISRLPEAPAERSVPKRMAPRKIGFSGRGVLGAARAWAVRAALLAAPLLGDVSCSGPPDSQEWVHPQGTVRVEVNRSPFGVVIKDAKGNILAESAPVHQSDDITDPVLAYAPIAVTQVLDFSLPDPIKGWDTFYGYNEPWSRSTDVSSFSTDGQALVAHVSTDGGPSVAFRIEPQGPGVRMTASIEGDPGQLNRVSMSFKMHSDAAGEHFLGFGERYMYSDHVGQAMTNWVEEDGLGNVPLWPGVPFPDGPSQTHIPIPWFMSPRGFGMLENGTFRTVHHLGDEAQDAWRVESWRTLLDTTLFAETDPLMLVQDLTGITGRPPQIPDWVIAPRRRADSLDEGAKLRAAGVPTSVLDLDVHYFPNGAGQDSAAMQAMTAGAHAMGYKAVAYFNPFIETTWTDVFNEAASKGYLVKQSDGTPYTVLDPNNQAGMVDFTNPDAVTWYQGWLQKALNDGWDGWMYDFAEYVPRDAVMFNGMSGDEAHNLYPVLYQKAAFDLLQMLRPANYLFFARSGFLGTGGLVPMVWAGDQNTDFDLADGLPAALTGALNAGMSGIPLWGSDISGYHFIFNPPPDKELYLRWTELGAFSADMHDENNGAGPPGSTASERWNIWSDQETLDTYRGYANLKTRMVPYVRMAVKEAQERGIPVMRHLYLNYPKDPNVLGISDEYMYGESLLVAPVVTQGLTSRSVYLPEPAYYDFWTGARIRGGGPVQAAAPLDLVPVYAKVGAIVPLLSPDVQSVVSAPDGSVVSEADRADFLEAAVFSGGSTSVTLDDGTILSQSAPAGPYVPGSPAYSGGPIPAAATQADLNTCAACSFDDPANHVWKVALVTAGDTITAGPLTLKVSGSPFPKRYLFSVRH